MIIDIHRPYAQMTSILREKGDGLPCDLVAPELSYVWFLGLSGRTRLTQLERHLPALLGNLERAGIILASSQVWRNSRAATTRTFVGWANSALSICPPAGSRLPLARPASSICSRQEPVGRPRLTRSRCRLAQRPARIRTSGVEAHQARPHAGR